MNNEKLNDILCVNDNPEILNSVAYKEIVRCFMYFIKFIDDSRVPNVLGMIEKMISNHLKDIKNPYARFVSKIFNAPSISLAIGSGEPGTSIVIISAKNTPGLEIKCGLDGEKDFSGPTIHIYNAGFGRSNWKELRDKGLHIMGHCLPREIAKIILDDFDKLEDDSRREIILKLAKSEDVVQCSDWKFKYCLEKYEIGEDTMEGVDSSSIWILNNPGSDVSIFGNLRGYVSPPYVLLSLRVERKGCKVEFPKDEWSLD